MTAPDLRFALGLHDRIAGPPEQNFAWSPYSVGSALGLTAAGSAGRTREELAATLTLDGDLGRLAAAFSAGGSLPGGEPPTAELAVANTLWADLLLEVKASYLDAVKSWPGGAARTVDFAGAPGDARQQINADVERATRGLISDLLAPGDVTKMTRAILVNALWLKASWMQRFADAQPRPFRTPAGRVDVPTMRVQTRMAYAARNGWQLVTVPAGAGVVADVLLPDGDLADAEAGLTAAGVEALLSAASPTDVVLELPTFRVEGQAYLKEPLSRLGLPTLFSDDCELTGITEDGPPLMVDEVVHKAVLTVDEGGLEGAAATAVVMRAMGAVIAPKPPWLVRVDRPFLVLIRHAASGALYFLARVADPRG